MKCNKKNDLSTDSTGRFVARLISVIIPAILLCCAGGPVIADIHTDQSPVREQSGSRYQNDTETNQLSMANPVKNETGGRQVRVGLYENKPKIFTGENTQPAGIFAGILEEIARRENWQVTYVPCNWSDCIAALVEGGIDLMPDVAFSMERDRIFDFHSENVIESWSQVYANSATSINKLSDLNSRRIAVLRGSIQKTVIEQLMQGFGYQVVMIEVQSFDEAFSLAGNGAVDAVISNHFYGNYYFQEYGLARTAIVLNPVSLYFAVADGVNHDLLDAIDSNLKRMKSEPGSVYYRELGTWMERPPRVVVPKYLVWTVFGFAAFLTLSFLLILLLRRQVRIKTGHLLAANETLRKSEEKFRNLFQNHAAVKLIVDPETGKIVEANRAAEKFYGWPVNELLGMRIQDIDTLPAEEVEAETKKTKAGRRIRFESRHRLADNSIGDVEVFGSRIDFAGKMLLHFIIHDITEHRKLEEQYRHATKMEAVGRLAGGVAHDYNNMLSVILGYAELILDKLKPEDPLHTDVTEILNAAKRTSDINRKLLAFARKETVTPEVFDLNARIEGMLKIIQQLAGEDIKVNWRPADKLWPVLMDSSQFDQILVNLCVNARDAIANAGEISVATDTVTFDHGYCSAHAGYMKGDFVLLTVSDNGCGMDGETIDKIFEPFFTTKATGQGTGLGLATVYGIVRQNNGFIKVYSEPSVGTSFRIYLPGNIGGSVKQAGDNEQIQKGRGETLLLVEDELMILKLAEKILVNLNYRVFTADSPAKALEIVKKHPDEISMLVTDMVMPEMNGRELADQVKSLCPGIKCIFMSGYTSNIIAHGAVLENGSRFIQKPFTATQLAGKVREALDESGETEQ